MTRGVRRPDGLKASSRKARALRGKPLKSISVSWATFEKLKLFSELTGLGMGGAIRFLIDGRPELHFKPILLGPRDPAMSDTERIVELNEFIAAVQATDDDDPEQWDRMLLAQAEREELMGQQDT